MKTIAILSLLLICRTGFTFAAQDSLPTRTLPFDQMHFPATKIGKYHWNKPLGNQPDTTVNPGDRIAVYVDRLVYDSVKAHLGEIRLWINGTVFKHLKPLFADDQHKSIVFQLTADTARASEWWHQFYASMNYRHFYQPVSVSIGTENRQCRASVYHFLIVRNSNPWLFVLGYTIFLAILIFILYFGKGIIRDTGIYIRNDVKLAYRRNQKTDVKKGIIHVRDIPFSIARVQFLVWLTVIFFSIIHIWVFRDLLSCPVGNVLLLLGISGTTFFVGKVIDGRRTQDDTRTATQIVSEFVSKHQQTKGFINDILSDGSSISLHRLQLLIFTLFLAVYFLRGVFLHLNLPGLSTEMLSLMGISSMTYAGIKTTETGPGNNVAPVSTTTGGNAGSNPPA